MGRLIADAFELRLTGAATVGFGAKYPLRVRVDNPSTGEPIAGVPIDFKLELNDDDDDQPTARKKAFTDRSGYAVAEFDLPKAPSDFEGKVVATATRGDFSEEESIDIKFPEAVRLTLTTDKPLYQPGQTVHMRVLAFGPDNRAFANVPIQVTLVDDQGQTQFEDTFNTSKFGVAKADWEIPQKLELGDYSITAEVERERYSDQEAQSTIRISRYELPAYTVKVHPNRASALAASRPAPQTGFVTAILSKFETTALPRGIAFLTAGQDRDADAVLTRALGFRRYNRPCLWH